jgi:RNA polymerase sigma factor (sigma-70 family)
MREKDYRLILKVKNNHLLKRMEICGIKNAAELSRESKVWPGEIGRMLDLSMTPYNDTGNIRPQVQRVCDVLMCAPEDIYPEAHMNSPLEKSLIEIEANAHELVPRHYLTGTEDPLSLLENEDASSRIIPAMLESLTVRERSVIEARYGFDGDSETIDEIADRFDVTPERIRQIERKALTRMRNPLVKGQRSGKA